MIDLQISTLKKKIFLHLVMDVYLLEQVRVTSEVKFVNPPEYFASAVTMILEIEVSSSSVTHG